MSSLTFNGTSDFGRSSPAVTAFPYSMCAWFYCTSIAAARGICHLNNSGSATNRAGIQVFTSGVLRMACADSANTSTDTVNTVTTNAWQFGAATFTSATSRKVILNGDTANAGGGAGQTARTPASLDRFSVGANDASTTGTFFIGQIFCVGLWNVALADEEVVAMSKGYPFGRVRPHALKQCFAYPGLAGRDWMGFSSLTITGATASTNTPSIRHPFS